MTAVLQSLWVPAMIAMLLVSKVDLVHVDIMTMMLGHPLSIFAQSLHQLNCKLSTEESSDNGTCRSYCEGKTGM